jgi:hypothetical protein
MGALMGIVTMLLLFQAICGLWMVISAYKASIGWFLFMVSMLFGGSVFFTASLGPALGSMVVLGCLLVFVVKHWDEVRTPFLLMLAATVIRVAVVRQADKTLAEQSRQQESAQVR